MAVVRAATMTRTTIMLPRTLRVRALRVAKARRISLGELIRVSLDRQLAADRPGAYAEDPLFDESAVFRGPDVPRDGALNHDKYLYDEP